MSYGEDLELGFCFQNSYGTPNVNSLFYLPVLSESISLKKEQLIKQGLRGIYDEGAHREGMNAIDGDIELEAHPIYLGVLLKAALGAPSVTAVGSVFQHVFIPSQSDFDVYAANPPLTITKNLQDGGSAQQFSDMVVNNVELNMPAGEFLKVKASIMGGSFAQIAAPTATYLDEVDWVWSVSSVQVGGVAMAGVKELNVKIDTPMESHYVLGSGDKEPSYIKRSGFRTITVDGTLLFLDQTEFQKFIAQSEEELILTLTGDVEVGSGYYDVLEIKCPNFRHIEHPIEAGGPGQIEVGISAKGVYNVNSGTGVRLMLQNTQSVY